MFLVQAPRLAQAPVPVQNKTDKPLNQPVSRPFSLYSHNPSVMFSFLLFLLLQAGFASANTEKIIFLGPSSLQVPLEHPTLENLQLDVLSPHHWSLRTYIQAEFPTNSSKYGQSSWYLLDRLQEGQRYEVRICWAATVWILFHCILWT